MHNEGHFNSPGGNVGARNENDQQRAGIPKLGPREELERGTFNAARPTISREDSGKREISYATSINIKKTVIDNNLLDVRREDLHKERGQIQYDPKSPFGSTQIPEPIILNKLCANAMRPENSSEKACSEASKSWEPVRNWLKNRTFDELRQAVHHRDFDTLLTPLHHACLNAAPEDIVNMLVSISPEPLMWGDNHNWLPIHYACAYSTDAKTIQKIAKLHPSSMTCVDQRGRTPLHFVCGQESETIPIEVVKLLCDAGASSFADDEGMYPIHYACGRCASQDAIRCIIDANPKAVAAMDHSSHTPLDFALSRASTKSAPAVIELLLKFDGGAVIDSYRRGGSSPLVTLGDHAWGKVGRDESQRENVRHCLQHILLAYEIPRVGFFATLATLPFWLQVHAVSMPEVKRLLNKHVSQRYQTFIVMTEFTFQLFIILGFSLYVTEAIDRRADSTRDNHISLPHLIPLYIGGLLYAARGIFQILSVLTLRSFRTWVLDRETYLNMAYVFVIVYWATQIYLGTMALEMFRTGAAISVAVLWLKLLDFLRNILIDFAVFVGVMFYVIRRLATFMVALTIVMAAFSQMFHTILGGNSQYCTRDVADQCDRDSRPYCTRLGSFLNVFTMMLGGVDHTKFSDSLFATCLFVIFVFSVVILLANILIGIVANSYKIIRSERASTVFWIKRLDFMAKADVFHDRPLIVAINRLDEMNTLVDTVFEARWNSLIEMARGGTRRDGKRNFEHAFVTLLQSIVALFLIPLWVLIGILTFGLFWPPQIRKILLTSSIDDFTSSKEKEEETRQKKIQDLKAQIETARIDLLEEYEADHGQVEQAKTEISGRMKDIRGEVQIMKHMMAQLHRRQTTRDL